MLDDFEDFEDEELDEEPEQDNEPKKRKEKSANVRRKPIDDDVIRWKLQGLMANSMNMIQTVHWQSDTYGHKIIFVFKEKPHDKEKYPLSPNIHNRFLALFRKFYKNTVLLDYDNMPDLIKREEAAEKARLKKEQKKMQEFKNSMEEHAKKEAEEHKAKQKAKKEKKENDQKALDQTRTETSDTVSE